MHVLVSPVLLEVTVGMTLATPCMSVEIYENIDLRDVDNYSEHICECHLQETRKLRPPKALIIECFFLNPAAENRLM